MRGPRLNEFGKSDERMRENVGDLKLRDDLRGPLTPRRLTHRSSHEPGYFRTTSDDARLHAHWSY